MIRGDYITFLICLGGANHFQPNLKNLKPVSSSSQRHMIPACGPTQVALALEGQAWWTKVYFWGTYAWVPRLGLRRTIKPVLP